MKKNVTLDPEQVKAASEGTVKNYMNIVCVCVAKDCNPNGDPDNGGAPRQDAITGEGLMTPGCIKSNIRGYVDMMHAEEDGFGITHVTAAKLNAIEKALAEDSGALSGATELTDKAFPSALAAQNKTTKDVACRMIAQGQKDYYDMRLFGHAFTTLSSAKVGESSLTGPVIVTMSRSVGEIDPIHVGITRKSTNATEGDKNTEIGEYYRVPCAAYTYGIRVNAARAQYNAKHYGEASVTEKDVELLIEALKNMYKYNHTDSKSGMEMHSIVVFRHDSLLGSCSDPAIERRVHVKVKDGVEDARDYWDYEVTVDQTDLPAGVTCEVIYCL